MKFIDFHCDTIYKIATTGGSLKENSYSIDSKKLKNSLAQFFAAYIDISKTSKPFEFCNNLIDSNGCLICNDSKRPKNKIFVVEKPKDIIKEPYVFEFLGIKEEKPLLEKDLEYKLIRQLEDFLLELGKGFMFVGSQQRITIDNTHYYVDMVFYNKILKCYVLIDLKMGKLKPENMGQMNMYLNYYETEVNDIEDNKPIGIILCAKKDNIVAEYSLGGINNNLFASNYTYYMPNKEELIAQVEKVIKENEEEKE